MTTIYNEENSKNHPLLLCDSLSLSFFVFVLETDPKHLLPYSLLRRTCGQAWHTIRSLKEDWQRLQQGQKAAMYDLHKYTHKVPQNTPMHQVC